MMRGFVRLHTKTYSYTIGIMNVKKAKNAIKGVIKRNLFNDDYKVVLQNKEQRMVRQTIISSAHKVYTNADTKVAFSSSDN